MSKKETMESSQSLWHNRRIQRSAGFTLFVLILIVLGLYSRRNWPEDAVIILDVPSTPQHTDIPSKSDLSNKKVEDPLYSSVPEYDADNMPTVPSSAAEIKESVLQTLPPLDPSRVALIIETRADPALPAVLTLFINGLPPAWTIRLVGSQEAFSIVMLSSSLARHIKSGKLTLTELPDTYKVHDSEVLSTTLTNLSFYSEFLQPAEWLLLFQTDSVVCAASEQTLDNWVEKGYSWVGAPWNLDKIGGNGGLSLRHVPSIVALLQNETRPEKADIWEDRWFCDRLPNIAPPHVARTFSVESVYYERPLGYHLRGSGRSLDPDIWHNNTRKRQIFRYCPETKIILGNMRLQSLTEAEDEQRDLAEIASAWNTVSKETAIGVADETKNSMSQTEAPTAAHISPTATTTDAIGPTETDRWTDNTKKS